MSLRYYLFVLIGGLIFLLTLAQLSLVYWIDKSLTKEVSKQAQVLSEKVIEFAFDEATIHELAESGKAKVVHVPKTDADSTMIVMPNSNSNVKVIHELITTQESNDDAIQNKLIVKKRLAQAFEHLKDVKSNSKQVEIVGEPSVQQQFWFEHNIETSSTSDKLISSIQWMIFACGVIALAFAYWLSIQFNRPLNALKRGFDALAKGDYQHRVQPQGIADIKQTMSQFNQMIERLEQLSIAEQHFKETAHLAELGEVSRGLAHTLRNPIHTIGLSIERLANNDLSGNERSEIIQTIQSKIAHIDNNIKSLLTLTTSGISRTDKVPVLAVVQDIVLEYKFAAPKPQSFDIDINSTLAITGAESEIRSILHTLIINACEANPANGVVNVSVKETNDELQIIVRDQGEGLKDEIAEQLFHPHISSKPEGAGMGLYIAKRIISLHYQGDLSLENNEQSGCTAKAKFYLGAAE